MTVLFLGLPASYSSTSASICRRIVMRMFMLTTDPLDGSGPFGSSDLSWSAVHSSSATANTRGCILFDGDFYFRVVSVAIATPERYFQWLQN